MAYACCLWLICLGETISSCFGTTHSRTQQLKQLSFFLVFVLFCFVPSLVYRLISCTVQKCTGTQTLNLKSNLKMNLNKKSLQVQLCLCEAVVCRDSSATYRMVALFKLILRCVPNFHPERKSGDHQSHQDTLSGNHVCKKSIPINQVDTEIFYWVRENSDLLMMLDEKEIHLYKILWQSIQ